MIPTMETVDPVVIESFEKVKQFQFPDFNESGLKWPTDILASIRRHLKLLPIEYLAEFADGVCVYLVRQRDPEITRQVMSKSALDADCNTTAVGNFAYISMHCHDQQTRAQALRLLDNHFSSPKMWFES